MKYLLRTVAVAALATCLATQAPVAANTLYFQINPNIDTDGSRQVFIFGAANTTGTLTGPGGVSQAFDLGAAGFTTITIPVINELAANTTEDKGFRIDSTGAVSGYFLNRRTASTDMTYLIDSTSLGTDHVVAGYQNIRQDQISVQATQDNTVVNFTPLSGAPAQVTLNAGQTFMFARSSELTGTRVTSDKPVAVFSGNACANVPDNNTACDHLVEQIPSTDLLSNTYLLAKTPRTGTQGNVVRVVATTDNTEVRFNGTLVATLNAGQFHEGRVPDGLEIVASQKVLVAEYLVGSTQAGAVTDPAMVVIPGQDQWLNSYVFAAPSGTANFPNDFVSIVMSTADIGTLTIKDIVADPALFKPLGTTAFSFGDFDVSAFDGPFAIKAASPFLLLLSGFDEFDSYFTYGGARFSPGASPPPPPPPPSGNIDVFWDGDGNPNDGIINGGDGILTATSPNLTVNTGSTNNTLPTEPANIIFQGAPGLVTVDDGLGPIRIQGLEFRVSGYRIVADPLTFGAATTVLVDGNADALATIDSVLLGGFGLTKTGPGRLVLNGINTYSGGTNITAGTLEGSATSFGAGGIAIAGTLIVDQPLNAIFANILSGTGSFIKRGPGRLTLTGVSTFSGASTVQSGRLVVDGSIRSSAVTVNSGASLGGNGTVGDVNLLAGSTIAPGSSIGTINVAGNFSQAAGATYEVELLSAGATDLVNVTGTAAIAPGAILQVVKLDAGRFVLGTRYTVLTAAGGRTGTYTLTGPTRVSQFINVVDTYDANNVYLNVRQTRALAAAGVTPNQIAAATGADTPFNGGLHTGLAYLQTDAEAQAAFDQISGEVHASVRGAALQDTRFVREAVGSRLGADVTGGSLWMHGYGASGRFSGDGNAAKVNRDLTGFFLGTDVPLGDGLAAGIVAGYAEGTIKIPNRRSRVDTADVHFGLYMGASTGPLRLHLGIAKMWRSARTNRSIAFTGFTDQLRAKYEVNTLQAFGEVGYGIAMGAAELEPFASLAYVEVDHSVFQEFGGAAAVRSRGANSDTYLVSNVGGRVNIGLSDKPGGLGISGSAAWRRISGGGANTPLGLGFAAGPAFTIAGAPVTRNAAALQLAITGKVSKAIEVDIGYSGQIAKGLSDHGGRASLTLRF